MLLAMVAAALPPVTSAVSSEEEGKRASHTWSLYVTIGDEVPSSGSGRLELLMGVLLFFLLMLLGHAL
jgi:hypothetical protein